MSFKHSKWAVILTYVLVFAAVHAVVFACIAEGWLIETIIGIVGWIVIWVSAHDWIWKDYKNSR